MIDSAIVAELLAIKGVLRVIISEKIAEYEDEQHVASELHAIVSDVVKQSKLSGPDEEAIKKGALESVALIFADL
jgi:hypothetical protein